jgi:hypothetical protein
MLAVDISFLAVPGVVAGGDVFISLSAMCSVGSLMVSIILRGESRGWGTDTAEGAVSCKSTLKGAMLMYHSGSIHGSNGSHTKRY